MTINGIKYVLLPESTAKLIQYTIQQEGQTFDFIPQDSIDKMSYPLSNRNSANSYIVPIEKSKLFLNFLPRKLHVLDSDVAKYLGNEFEYFVPPPIIPPVLFTLPDGQMFRCTSENSVPMEPYQYTYYVMVGDEAKLIPNYKTVEVMLAERGQTLLSVRVITEKQCSDIPKNGQVPDKSGNWTEDYEDQSTFQKLKKLDNDVKTGKQLADDAKKSAATQIDAVKAQAAASAAQAAAAQAQSQADKAAADAAIAQANAAKAQADAAKAKYDSTK